MSDVRRSEFGQGLILLGAIGIALNTIFLCLDWISFDDRSNTESALLVASILGACAGGWLLRSPQAAVEGLCAGVFLGALFLFAVAFLRVAEERLLLPGAQPALAARRASRAPGVRQRAGRHCPAPAPRQRPGLARRRAPATRAGNLSPPRP